jgi:hypothetical protein
LLRGFQRVLLAAFESLRRASRRSAPSVLRLENRTLLSGQAADKALLDSVRMVSSRDSVRMSEAVKPSKQAAFVIGLYRTYFHRNPNPAELSHALEQLASGLSRNALRRDFQDVVSPTGNHVSGPRYVQALFATIGGRAPTPTSRTYWLDLLAGLGRQRIRQMFEATHGALPPPVVSWTTPSSIVYGTPLGIDQLNATANVPGTFTYSPHAGTVLDALFNQPLTVVFTPDDTVDYSSVSASVPISVYAANPTITWHRPQAIEFGTPLSVTQLSASASSTVGRQTVSVAGTFTYSSPVGTVLPVGSNLSLTAVFRPFDSANYNVVIKTTNITVTFGPPPPTPTPPPPTPPPPTPHPSPPSPTPSPTPYPTPAPTPENAIVRTVHAQRLTPSPTPPPTPFGIIPLSATDTPKAPPTVLGLVPTAADPSRTILTPPPLADSLEPEPRAPGSSQNEAPALMTPATIHQQDQGDGDEQNRPTR